MLGDVTSTIPASASVSASASVLGTKAAHR
jgi:hypothetical protein